MPLKFFKPGMDAEFGETEHESVHTEQLQHGDSEGVPQSVHANVYAGRPVIYADGVGCKSVSFDDYATDDAALQALIDWAGFSGIAYELHIPGRKSDGSVITIENTVEACNASDRPTAVIRVHTTRWDGDGGIQTTIDDGSPMFRFDGAGQHSKFLGGWLRLRHNNASGIEWINTFHFTCKPAWIEWFSGSGIIVNSKCFGFLIDECRIRPDHVDAYAIEMRDDADPDGDSPPGYGSVGSGFVCDADCDTVFKHCPSGRSVTLAGHYEDAVGTAAIDLSGANGVFTDEGRIVLTKNGAHGIYADAGNFQVNGGVISSVSGDAIHTEGQQNLLNISPNVTYEGISGHSIYLAERPGLKGIVPHPEVVRGSTLYPDPNISGGWGPLRTTDGWRLDGSGSVTVPAGDEATIDGYVGNGSYPLSMSFDVRHWIEEPTPTADVRYRLAQGYDQSRDRGWVGFEETMGNADVNVEYEIWSRSSRVDTV